MNIEKQFVILSLLTSMLAPAQAFPPFLKKYSVHPRSKAEFKQDCSLCHIEAGGGGERNEFGEAFAREGAEITKELIEKFPSRFAPNARN